MQTFERIQAAADDHLQEATLEGIGAVVVVQGKGSTPVDAALLDHHPVNFHPLTNTGTTAIARDDLERFARATGHGFEVVDFTQLLDEV